MGLIILDKNINKDTLIMSLYLLSCRILGRGIENICLHWIAHRMREKGYKYLKVAFKKK